MDDYLGDVSSYFGDTSGFSGGFGLDNGATFEQPRDWLTVPSNALQSMQPLVANTGSEWTGFFQDVGRNLLGYAVARDAAKNNVGQVYTAGPTNTPAAGAGAAAKPAGMPPLFLLLIVGGIAYAVAKA